jgi:agmatinase
MADLVLQGIRFDEKSSYLKGTADAPPIIRRVLNNGAGNYYTENGIDLSETILDDKGDFNIKSYFDIEEVTRKNLESSLPLITLGGDHSISYPIIKAVVEKFGAIDILQIDAHGDLYDDFEGDKYSHACPFARIMEAGLAQRLVQVGIRTLTTHQREQAERFNVDIREMKSLAISDIKEFEHPLYISLDIDGIDPAFAPGVAHPEPGGLTSRQVIDLINQIETPIIGADIVEYNPKRDTHEITAVLAAKLLKEIWGKIIENKR